MGANCLPLFKLERFNSSLRLAYIAQNISTFQMISKKIRPPADPKGPPFDTFSEIHFCPTDPKIFLKAPLAPIYTNFEGERAPKKTRFFCQNLSKSAQKRLFWLFFQKFACGAENFAKIRGKHCFGRARKINLVDLKKKKGRQNFRFFFENPPPPSRKS